MGFLLDWLVTMWLYISAGIAGGAAFFVLSKGKVLPASRRICGIFVVFLVCHMLEEYAWPGGFHYIFNMINGSTDPSAYPLNTLSALVSNFVAVILFALVLWKLSEKVWVTLVIALFGIAQLAVHMTIGIFSFELYGRAGQVLPYSPGLLTSVFLFLPLSVYCLISIAKCKYLSFEHIGQSLKQTGIAVLVVVLLVAGLIMAPVAILGSNPDTIYTFMDNGYYSQFHDYQSP